MGKGSILYIQLNYRLQKTVYFPSGQSRNIFNSMLVQTLIVVLHIKVWDKKSIYRYLILVHKLRIK